MPFKSANKGKVIRLLLKRDGPRCFYCGKDPWPRTCTIDHFIPTLHGGTDSPDNLRLACRKCNGRKGNKMPAEFASTQR